MRVMTKEEYDEYMAAHTANARVAMKEHDQLPVYLRLKHYSGSGLGGTETDHTWNRQHQQARLSRYRITPAQLRRMGIGC